MAKKVYSVTVSKTPPGTIMVRADNCNQAIRHVAAKCIEAEMLNADEALTMVSKGTKIETAGEDNETAPLL